MRGRRGLAFAACEKRAEGSERERREENAKLSVLVDLRIDKLMLPWSDCVGLHWGLEQCALFGSILSVSEKREQVRASTGSPLPGCGHVCTSVRHGCSMWYACCTPAALLLSQNLRRNTAQYFGIGKIGRPAGYQVIGKRELDIEVLTCSSKSVQIFKRRKGKPYDLCNPNTARKSSNMCACNLLHAGTRRCD